MKASVVCVSALVAGLALAEQGRPCSRPLELTPTEPRAVVAEADAAFIGTLVAVAPKEPRSLSPAAQHILTFAVEEELKGELGDRVEVTSTLGGASCGHDGTIGRRGAYVLSRRDGVWGPWSMTEVTVEAVRRGVLPLPKPDGVGRPAFVAAGHFGLVRTATLDARGRTLAYGAGRGAVTALSVCPGGRVVVELVGVGMSVRLAARALPSLRLLRETELRPSGYGGRVVCRDRTGSDVFAAVDGTPETHLVRITPVGSRIVERAPRLGFAARADQVVVSLSGGRLVLRDLAAGTRRIVARTGLLLTGMSTSPDLRFVTGFSAERLVVADMLRGTTRAKPWRGYASETRWIGPRTFAAWSRRSGGLELLDPNLRRQQPASTWRAHTTAVSSAGVFGVDWSGAFLSEKDGRVVRLGHVFSPAISVLDAL